MLKQTFWYVLDTTSARFIFLLSIWIPMTSFLIKCLRQKQNNNLYRYYICEFMHNLICLKAYNDWERKVTKSINGLFYLQIFIINTCRNQYLHNFINLMWGQFLPKFLVKQLWQFNKPWRD